jgi:hypothetical protein
VAQFHPFIPGGMQPNSTRGAPTAAPPFAQPDQFQQQNTAWQVNQLPAFIFPDQTVVAPTTPLIQPIVIRSLPRPARTRQARIIQSRTIVAPAGPVVTPLIQPVVLKAPSQKKSRKTQIVTNRWPGYQWVGLPPVAPLIQPKVVLAAPRPDRARRATHIIQTRPIVVPVVVTVTPLVQPVIVASKQPKQDRRTSVIQNRWPGYQWVGLPPVPPPVQPKVLLVPSPKQDRRTRIITNRWPGYQWVGLPPVNPLVEPIIIKAPNPRQDRRTRIIQLRAQPQGVVTPIRPTIIIAPAPKQDRKTRIIQPRPIFNITPPVVTPLKTVWVLSTRQPQVYRKGRIIMVRGINLTGAPTPPPPVTTIVPDTPGGTLWVEVGGGYRNPHRPAGWKTRRGW